MFKDWHVITGIEDPHTGWLKINIKHPDRTIYEKQQGAFRLLIVAEANDVSIGFAISEDDFSVCHVPVPPIEVQNLLSRWTVRKKMTDNKILNEMRELRHG